MLDINPWKSMWTKPRETVRAVIAHNPNHGFLPISAIYGFTQCVSLAQTFSLGHSFNFYLVILACLVLAIPVGAISIYFTSFIVYILGKLIKGQASFTDVKAAFTWSYVPYTVFAVLSIVAMFMTGPDFFTQSFAATQRNVGLSSALTAVFLGQFTMAIWTLVLFIKALSEVQKVSGWMALLNIILTMILLTLLAFLFGKVMGVFQFIS